ncbi:MAG TPA: polyprenol monophosphomannose synthase [Elusimicrobiales bacterium]|nr:polyprenol monophosphomannose synthase [Elusimicrobiales bacterium]
MKAIIVVPTYNEKENIEPLAAKVLRLDLPVELVFIDDASPDGTGALLDRLCAGDARLHVIHRTGPRRLGTAYIAGFRYAMDRRPDFVLTMDADLSHDPAAIPALLEAAGNFDLVIGSRYVRGGKTVNSPFGRRLISRCGNLLARLLPGLKAADCTSGFRCYRLSVLEAVQLGEIFSDGYSFLIEMLYRAQSLGLSTVEVPITFTDRILGVSKISRGEILKALYTVLKLGLLRARGR